MAEEALNYRLDDFFLDVVYRQLSSSFSVLTFG
jgi:hypothetical protein